MRRAIWALLAGGCWSAAPRTPAPIANTSTAAPMRASGVERWTGVGHQFDDDSHWEMDLRFDPTLPVGATFGTVEYPSLGCGGELIREPDRGDVLIAREHITHDPEEHCIDGGEMTIPIERGMTFHWTWRQPETAEIDADAELHRVVHGGARPTQAPDASK